MLFLFLLQVRPVEEDHLDNLAVAALTRDMQGIIAIAVRAADVDAAIYEHFNDANLRLFRG